MDWFPGAGPLLLTAKLAAITVIGLLIVGTPLAWWLALGVQQNKSRWHGYVRVVVEALVALPLVLPPTVLGFYLLMAMGANGTLGQWWIGLTGEPLAFSFTGLVIASMIYSLPFVVQPLSNAFQSMGRDWMEAAWSLGANRWQTWLRVVVPHCRAGFLTATVLGFAHTLGEFGVVLMVGGNIPDETRVVSIAVYDLVESMSYGAAHKLSLILLGFSFLILILVYGFNRRWSRL